MKSFTLNFLHTNTKFKLCGSKCIRRIQRKPHVKLYITVYKDEIRGQYYIACNDFNDDKEFYNIISLDGICRVYSYMRNYKKEYKPKKYFKFINASSYHGTDVYIPLKSWNEAAKFKLKYT